MRSVLLTTLLIATALAGCVDSSDDTPDAGSDSQNFAEARYEHYTIPAIFGEPTPVSPREAQGDDKIGLYEPTIDVGPEGNIYVSSHSADVGLYPAPAHFSVDDGVTWESMALFANYQGEPEEHMSAPLFSDEVFIVAGAEGQAWGMDCCTNDNANPLVGWGSNGAEVEYYNHNAHDQSRFVVDPVLHPAECVPAPGTDRPWLAYANGKLLLVNNPGLSAMSGGEALSGIALQVGAMDVPPLAPVAYSAAAWGIEWNLCGSSGGFIPGIPDMRDDHFFAVPQWMDFSNNECGSESYYDVITGYADDVQAVTQTTVFKNSHVRPAEDDSAPSQIGLYGQASFDANGALYVGAMNNTAASCEAIEGDDFLVFAGSTRYEREVGTGGIHLAVSTDDAASFVETTFEFDRPVSAFYMDGNRHGEGFLLNWGEIDGNHTDWFFGHVFINDDGTLRLDNVMLALDDGPEASRHVQGAALGPDGRAYMVYSYNSQNPGASDRAEDGDVPLRVAVQQDGPMMPVS